MGVAVSGLLIAANFFYVYLLVPWLRKRAMACPPDDPFACEKADRAGRVVLWLSAAIHVAGFFSAYFLGPLLMRFVTKFGLSCKRTGKL